MEKIYHPYWDWEDYNNGMYEFLDYDDNLIKKCIKLFKDEILFTETLNRILVEWLISVDENLSNIYINRRAWLGRAACCYKYKCPDNLSRIAWSKLDIKSQQIANIIANKIIETYEKRNKKLHRNMGEALLF